MSLRTRLGLAAASLAVAALGAVTFAEATTSVAASPGTSCAPSVPCLIAQLQCDNKQCRG